MENIRDKLFFSLIFMSSCLVLIVFYSDVKNIDSSEIFTIYINVSTEDSKYLVYNSKCRIPKLDPFNSEAKPFYGPRPYKSCSKLPLLSYMTKNGDVAVLHVNQSLVKLYQKNGRVSCCYSSIQRNKPESPNPDDGFKTLDCIPFERNVSLARDEKYIRIDCKDAETKKGVYKNIHPVLLKTPEIQEKIQVWKARPSQPFSVIFVGIDSISRLNLMRAMPKTYKFLSENGYISFNGYNKVEDNTFPNVIAIATGYNYTTAEKICEPKKKGKLDSCAFIWSDYRKLGYVTMYAEDETWINTFNYHKKGFSRPPFDFYMRPYMLASEDLGQTPMDTMRSYCSGPVTSGERIMNVARDFVQTFRDVPKFGFFWMNTFSHNQLMAPSRMDGRVQEFLQDITQPHLLANTFVIFISDHGIRFGGIRKTATGWLEERLPYFFLRVPEEFKRKFPQEYGHLHASTNKLTSPYDLHMTLQHLLVLSRFNYTEKAAQGCPKCKSLFTPLESERGCEDAGIVEHYCTCMSYKDTQGRNRDTVNQAAAFIVQEIANIVNSSKSDCAKYALGKIVSSRASQQSGSPEMQHFLLVIQTIPKALFEATVSYANSTDGGSFALQGGISRVDKYEPHSKCERDAFLRKYCYCLTDIFL